MGDGFAGHSASGLAFLLLGNWFAVHPHILHHHCHSPHPHYAFFNCCCWIFTPPKLSWSSDQHLPSLVAISVQRASFSNQSLISERVGSIIIMTINYFFTNCILRWRQPWESVVKIAITLGYASGEVREIIPRKKSALYLIKKHPVWRYFFHSQQFLTGWWAEYTFLLHAQHITMCGFFIVNGIVDILIFKKVKLSLRLQHCNTIISFQNTSILCDLPSAFLIILTRLWSKYHKGFRSIQISGSNSKRCPIPDCKPCLSCWEFFVHQPQPWEERSAPGEKGKWRSHFCYTCRAASGFSKTDIHVLGYRYFCLKRG